MRRTKIIRIVGIGCLAVAGGWLLSLMHYPYRSEAAIGTLDLDTPHAGFRARFRAPKNLHSIALAFHNPDLGLEEPDYRPDFPLVLHIVVTQTDGTSIIDHKVASERMYWTRWNHRPSLSIEMNGWGQLRTGSEYDIFVSVDSPAADLGKAEVLLRWLDVGSSWGRERRKLKVIEHPPN